ncbi:MAG: hypothetical protein ACE5WD_00125 [Candidatus Aminicenantia bacterium]
MKGINQDFFDLEMYSIYRAIGELWGEKAWKVVWRSGEILFSELNNQLNLKKGKINEVLAALTKYLEEVGYIEKIEIVFTKKDEIEYKMRNPSILKSAFRLIKENYVPPHISTSLIVAALNKLFNLNVEMIGSPIQDENGWTVERWKLIEK